MRNILLVFLLSWAISDTFGQVQFLGSPTTTVRNRGNFVSDSLFYLPKRQKAPSDTGAIRYAIADSSVYVWSGFQWAKVGAGSLTSITAGTGLTGGTITTSGTIAADTLTLSTRAWRQKGIDSVNANVALKVNISDTSSMLSPYIRAAGYGLTKSGQSLIVDTAAMATRARVQKGIDSLGTVKGSGTVTSVSAGTGMSFTTITSTGSVAADTTVLSTRAWRRKGLDSLAALELSLSDTSNMLSPYIRAAGFGLTKSGQSLLVDSATMATRARVQKGIDSVAGLARVTGSGTTNYVPKFTGSTALGNSQIFDNGTNVGVGTASPISFAKATIQSGVDDAFILLRSTDPTTATSAANIRSPINTGFSATPIYSFYFQSGTGIANPTNNVVAINTQGSERARITSDGELLVNTSSDAGAYALQVAGSIYNTTGAVLAATSGNVGIGTTSPSERLHVSGKARITTIDSSSSPINLLWSNVDGVIQKTAVASVIGSGTAKYIPKFATATTLTNSLIYEDNNEVRINTTSDAGDWVLQVSGNSLVSNGQLRVSANANTGISLARSGTSEVFMETGNTSGGLKVGVAGSTGGSSQGFSGYAGYILTNAAYPLQFGSLDTMRMTLNTAGELLISTSTTDNGNYKLQVDGNVWSTGSLTTGDPTSGTKKPWKLGSKVATSVQLDTANYVEVEIDGVLVRLAIVTPL